jgi:hypothetical protein
LYLLKADDFIIHILIGKTMTWGIPSDWYMKWCMDGKFYERFSNSEITQEWGHDGKTTWYADIAGRVLKLGMDEAEVWRSPAGFLKLLNSVLSSRIYCVLRGVLVCIQPK